ncbi:uncharacterized protein LOC115622665 isoform X1 [Scaptodrosophila lebanonensis]|uniref:Uncharacterized protein LOC115622665 isoform X1 n=1 Tax=Drosophila lebanonensis TaxID=7225 RepID=A0A6J2TBN6_DROLE|nr:uncharacterized protein LOC115622665 isoform X1 [Scaptodrosophila lebanonensis]
MLTLLTLLCCLTSLTMCYQRQSVNNNNHNNVDPKPTHLPPLHYPHGHKWNEPYFDLTMPRNITSLVGKSAYLGCRVKHLGNKTVAWIRHRDLHILTVGTYTYTTDQRFQTSYHRDIDEWTLQIKWAQQRDAGVYECQISTQPVRSFSVNLNIVVPTATILGGPDLYVDKGSTINLTCIIKFSPEPPTHIFWYHQDKVLSEETAGGRLKFKTIKSEETKSILLIYDADLLHSGKYSCYPSNTEIASIRVHVLQGERPEAMQTNAAPAAVAVACHTEHATPAVKVISTMVAAFVLLEACCTLLRPQWRSWGHGSGSGCGSGSVSKQSKSKAGKHERTHSVTQKRPSQRQMQRQITEQDKSNDQPREHHQQQQKKQGASQTLSTQMATTLLRHLHVNTTVR